MTPLRIKIYSCHILTVIFLTCGLYSTAVAWGDDGHTAVGMLAMNLLQPGAKQQLDEVLGSSSIAEACNWPDRLRDTPEGSWSKPLHYINIPKGASHYSQARDCPENQCATEAIKGYALVLADPRTGHKQRWQAFGWVCHLVGDLHQPLHAGYKSDRGGNTVEIVFNGKTIDLHYFWDSGLLKYRAGDWKGLVKRLGNKPYSNAHYDQQNDQWSSAMTNDWTSESHLLAGTIYPHSKVISQQQEERAWVIIQQQISLAAERLALIINTVFSR